MMVAPSGGEGLVDMKNASNVSSQFPRLDYFAEVALALLHIRDTRASGRLSLRNNERIGLAHLYFKDARLVHLAGDRKDGEDILKDLLTWSKGSVRFDPGMSVHHGNVVWQHVEIFAQWLSLVEMRGVVHGIPRARLHGLMQHLTAHLPHRPIALPPAVERYGERRESQFVQRSVLLGREVQQFVERLHLREQYGQIADASHSAVQHTGEMLQQTGVVVQALTKRVTKLTQEGVAQAMGIAQSKARQMAQRAEEVLAERVRKDRL